MNQNVPVTPTLSLVAWGYLRMAEKGIRSDMARIRNNESPINGIPHHGVLMAAGVKFLLAVGLWISQVVLTINLNMETGAIVFTAANVITDFLLIGGVQLLCRIERGFSTTVDIMPAHAV